MAAPARSLVRIAPLVSQEPASAISPAPPLQNGRDLYPPTPLSPSPSRHRRSWPPPSHYYYYDPPPPGAENLAARYGMLSIFLIVLFGMLVMVCAAARRGCSPRTDRSRLERERAATAQQASASSRPPASTTVLRQAPAALDSATIQALPLFGYRRTTPEEGFPDVARIKGHGDCPVCLAEFSEGEMVRLMPNCLHVFHPHCIDPWLLAHPSCPICREPVHASKSSRATT